MKRLLTTMICVSGIAFAVPAYQGEIEFKQHDGSAFKGHLKGDEYFSWVEDKQGNIIKFNKQSKDYEYAKLQQTQGVIDLVPSGIKVDTISGIKKSTSFNLPKISKEKLFELWKDKKEKTKYHH